MKRGRNNNNDLSHLYSSATTSNSSVLKEASKPKAKEKAKFASTRVPDNKNPTKTRADFQQIDGISFYKLVCQFILLEAHVNNGVSHQAIFDSEKQDL